MKEIDLMDFTNFVAHCYDNESHSQSESWDESLRIEGYHSAKCVLRNRTAVILLSDEDYTWFILKWG